MRVSTRGQCPRCLKPAVLNPTGICDPCGRAQAEGVEDAAPETPARQNSGSTADWFLNAGCGLSCAVFMLGFAVIVLRVMWAFAERWLL